MRTLVLLVVLVGLGGYMWSAKGGAAAEALSRWLPSALRPAAPSEPAQPSKPAQPGVLPPVEAPQPLTQPAPPGDQSPAQPIAAPIISPNQVTLYLANGGIVTGELVTETPEAVTLRWDYGDVGFQRVEIQRLERGRPHPDGQDMVMPWEGEHLKIHWPYRHNPVFRLMRGTILDGRITQVTPESVSVAQELEGGGTIEHTVARADIEEAVFRPIRNERSSQIEAGLAELFPSMQMYPEGMFTIVTDSNATEVRDYRRTVRELAMDWYLTFHRLAQGREPTVQQYVVIFDDWTAYMDYAATDGLPGWMTVGYFNPEDETLYCFNMLGERFSELLYDAYLGRLRKARDQVSAQIKESRYAVFVEGQMSEFLQKFETAHSMIRQIYREYSTAILRHELTHALFHNWRLQGVILSKLPAVDPELVKKKQDYLSATDADKKRQLLHALLSGSADAEPLVAQADNSWYIEGLAGYMEPWPVGAINADRLASLQEARSRQHILPLEFLNAFRLGSFLGMANRSALDAYAQSWGFSHFLMHRHRDGFLAYLDRLAREQPQPGQDTLPWLLEAVGQPDQRALEQDFLAYLDAFPAQEPLWLQQMGAFIDLGRELETLASRLWGG